MGNMQQRVDMSEGVTWESVKLAFSTGGYPDEPPLLEGYQNPVESIDSFCGSNTF